LRALDKINQQYFGIRKVCGFSNLENYVDAVGGTTPVVYEIVINSAVGGETTGQLDFFTVKTGSYTIYKIFTPMTENVDYTLNRYTGVITFLTPLNPGDHIKASYTYGFGLNTVTFAMQTLTGETNSVIGLNYVGLAVNGYGVKMTNVNNFTYRSPYTLSGFTGSLELSEV
jgi:hypothetical protein